MKTQEQIEKLLEIVRNRKVTKLNSLDLEQDFLTSMDNESIECIVQTLEWVLSDKKEFFDVKGLD